jgi:hypothetical protein
MFAIESCRTAHSASQLVPPSTASLVVQAAPPHRCGLRLARAPQAPPAFCETKPIFRTGAALITAPTQSLGEGIAAQWLIRGIVGTSYRRFPAARGAYTQGSGLPVCGLPQHRRYRGDATSVSAVSRTLPVPRLAMTPFGGAAKLPNWSWPTPRSNGSPRRADLRHRLYNHWHVPFPSEDCLALTCWH